MKDGIGNYQIVDISAGRQAWLNTLDLPGPQHWMTGLLEADVTAARKGIAEHNQLTGEKLSFTGFLVYCLARAVDEHREVQAYLKGRRKLVQFEDVNVGLMIENQHGSSRSLMGHVIRAAQEKTLREIHTEIRRVQTSPVPPSHGMPRWFRWLMRLPWPFSKLVKAFLGFATRQDPTIRVASSGTVVVTAVGMFGRGHSGWGIASMPVSLSLVVGSITTKPGFVDGRIEPREILHLTVLFDHDVVDGAPAARFTRRLLELIEGAAGLAAVVDSAPISGKPLENQE
jgi:hypothetical protein